MKYLLEWQYQEMAETSHDRGCARCTRGTDLLTAQTSPDLTKGSFGSLFELPDPLAVGSHYIDSKYLPHPSRQTDTLPKWSSSALQIIKYCAFLVKTVVAKT